MTIATNNFINNITSHKTLCQNAKAILILVPFLDPLKKGFSHPRKSRITGGFDEMLGAHKGLVDWDPVFGLAEAVNPFPSTEAKDWSGLVNYRPLLVF